MSVRVVASSGTITPALGRRAEDRFESSMDALGYDVWRYDAYSQIKLFLPPQVAQRVEAGLQADYDPTALFWRSAPDYGVRPRQGGRCWLAEVKGPSVQWSNLVLEATQLLNLYLLAQCLWLDIRYVYAAEGQALRYQPVEDVLVSARAVYVNPDHPSAATLRRLRRQTDVRWEERPNARFYDPYVKVVREVLEQWPCVPPASGGLGCGIGHCDL